MDAIWQLLISDNGSRIIVITGGLLAIAATLYKSRRGLTLGVASLFGLCIYYAFWAGLMTAVRFTQTTALSSTDFGLTSSALSIFGVAAAMVERHSLKQAMRRAVFAEIVWLGMISFALQFFTAEWNFWFTVQVLFIALTLGLYAGFTTYGIKWLGGIWESSFQQS